MELREAIEKAKRDFGEDCIFNRNLVSVLADYGAFKDFPASRIIIKELVCSGFLADYSLANQERRSAIIQNIVTNYGFDTNQLKRVLSAFFCGINSVIRQDEQLYHSNTNTTSNQKSSTDIIFIVDASMESYTSHDSINFAINEIVKAIGDNAKYRLIHYNDISVWASNGVKSSSDFRIPFVSHVGSNNFNQVLNTISNVSIDWTKQNYCPILIWFVGSNSSSDYSNTLSNLRDSDILFNKALCFTIYFGNKVCVDKLDDFSKGETYSSIEIDEMLSSISRHLGRKLISADAFPEDSDVILLNKKIAFQREITLSPERMIMEKSKFFSTGIFRCKKNNKWGWMGVNGEQFIPFMYETTLDFTEGLAAVSSNGRPKNKARGWGLSIPAKWGFINILGQQIIPEMYDDVKPYRDGIALVELDGKWGAIDKYGNEVVACTYSNIQFASKNVLKVTKSTYTSSNSNSVEKSGYISTTGEIICECIYDFVSYELKNNRAIVKIGDETYLMNHKGRRVAKIPYYSVDFFYTGDFLIVSKGWINRKLLYGLTTLDGSELIPVKYVKLTMGANDIIMATGDSFVDYYNTLGVKINKIPLSLGFEFVEGFTVVKDTNKWYKMTASGDLTELSFEDVYYLCKNGNLIVKYSKDKYPDIPYCAVVDTMGVLKFRPFMLYTHDLSHKYSDFHEWVEIEDIGSEEHKSDARKYWFNKYNGARIHSCNVYHTSHDVNVYNNIAVVSEYHSESYYYNSFHAFLTNGNASNERIKIPAYTKYHIIDFFSGKGIGSTRDSNGEIHRKEFDYIGPLSEELMSFKSQNKCGYINKDSDVIIQARYDTVKPFVNGFAIVGKNDKFFLIDKNGDQVSQFFEDMTIVQVKGYGNV